MKVCESCGAIYRDYIDFCFGDGEVLRTISTEHLAEFTASPESCRELPIEILVETAHTAPPPPPIPKTPPAPDTPVIDPQTLALIQQVEEAVRASVAAAHRREQRRQSAEAWQRLWSRLSSRFGGTLCMVLTAHTLSGI